MATHTHESARRVTRCITALLSTQPFFGSLRPPTAARTRPHSQHPGQRRPPHPLQPTWIAETPAHFIQTAIARVVLACSLKHHTRRAAREPHTWQHASQLVTHALLTDAGFTLPDSAEAWPDLSAEDAYAKLRARAPDPSPDPSDDPAQNPTQDPSPDPHTPPGDAQDPAPPNTDATAPDPHFHGQPRPIRHRRNPRLARHLRQPRRTTPPTHPPPSPPKNNNGTRPCTRP